MTKPRHLTQKEAELVAREWFKQYRGASGIDVAVIHAHPGRAGTGAGTDAKDGLIRRAAFDDDAGTLPWQRRYHVADPEANARDPACMKCWPPFCSRRLGDGNTAKLMSPAHSGRRKTPA